MLNVRAPLAPPLGAKLTVDELDEILLIDEGVPFVDTASERVCVTELLKRDDPRHASPAAVQALRKEIEVHNGHDFADWAHTVRIDEWDA